MSKFLTKTVKKATLLSVILAIVLAAAIVVGALFGFNKEYTVKDTQTVTVSVNSHAYETKLDEIKKDCNEIFKAADTVIYEIHGDMTGIEDEIVFVFDADADLTKAVSDLKAHFAQKTATGAEWDGTFISVVAHKENGVTYLAEDYVLRGVIAGVIFAVLAFVYVSLRYRMDMGIVAALSVLLGMIFTTAIVALTRICVSASTMYVIVAAGLLSAITALMTFNRLRLKSKEEGADEKSADELIVSSVAVKEIAGLCLTLGVAVLLVGILGGASAAWFAVSAIVGIAVAAFLGICYVPAVYLPMKVRTDAKRASKENRYKGAEKTSKKVKKSVNKTEEAEEAKEEPKAEEAPAEAEAEVEVAEEATEEPVAEEATEETEQVEEAEETEEEKTQE